MELRDAKKNDIFKKDKSIKEGRLWNTPAYWHLTQHGTLMKKVQNK